jgi:hypothetical protein
MSLLWGTALGTSSLCSDSNNVSFHNSVSPRISLLFVWALDFRCRSLFQLPTRWTSDGCWACGLVDAQGTGRAVNRSFPGDPEELSLVRFSLVAIGSAFRSYKLWLACCISCIGNVVSISIRSERQHHRLDSNFWLVVSRWFERLPSSEVLPWALSYL